MGNLECMYVCMYVYVCVSLEVTIRFIYLVLFKAMEWKLSPREREQNEEKGRPAVILIL